jgi:hypothetical protein
VPHSVFPVAIYVSCSGANKGKTVALGCPYIMDKGEAGVKFLFAKIEYLPGVSRGQSIKKFWRKNKERNQLTFNSSNTWDLRIL